MNCIVNNNDFPGLTGLEVAANWRPNPNHGVPSTLLLRKNLFQINLPFGVRFQNILIPKRFVIQTTKGILRKTVAISYI